MTDSIPSMPAAWQTLALEYREAPAIQIALTSSSKPRLKADLSLIRELSHAFPFLREEDKATMSIRGPSDLSRALGTASELQSLKDRAAEITLIYSNMLSHLERLRDVINTHVLLQPEVLKMKNAGQRTAIVSLVCPDLDDRLSRVKRVLSAASTVSKNINQSYNILKLQIEVVKEMMYEGGLTNVGRVKDRERV